MHREKASKHFPAVALSLSVIALAAALTCVSGCKRTPDVDPVPTPVPEVTTTAVPGATATPTPAQSGKCVDADGTEFAEGYRYQIGKQVFECVAGRFVEIELKACTDADGTVRPHGYEYGIGSHRWRCEDGTYVEVD